MTPLFLAAWLATASASPAPAPASDPCARRIDIDTARSATAAKRAELRDVLARELASAEGRARGCVAAIAAEAAFLDGDPAAARALLAVTAAELPAIRADIAPHRALLAAEAGDVAEADALLAVIDARAVAWRERVALAIARQQNNNDAMTQVLRRAGSRDPRALRTLCERGEQARCVDLVVRFAGSPEARAIEDSVDVVAFDVDTMAARVDALLAVARPKRVVAEATRWFAKHATDVGAGRVRATWAQALLRLNAAADAVALTRGYVTHDESGAVSGYDIDVARVHAKALGRSGDFAGASAVWHALATAASTTLPSTKTADLAAEARFFEAFSLVEADDVDGALAAFDVAASFVVGTPWEVQTAWQRGLLLLTAKNDAAAALPFLDAAVKKNDKEVRKHRYWRARALDVVDAARARRERLILLGEDSLDWYGQLARRDLGLAPIGGSDVSGDALVVASAALVDDNAQRVRLLFALGFDEEARQACRARALGQLASTSTSTSASTSKNEHAPTTLDLGLCQSVDDANFGWRRGSSYLPTPQLKKSKLNPSSSWRVSYATPFASSVAAAAEAAQIPRSFVYAIMRTESGFDSRAVSVAGARGALQLLPSVARKVGTLVPHSGAGDVDDDIALGAGLLGLLAREHGSLLLAAAAYNGAPENAQSWATRFGRFPVDVFVERIPFKETRDYVKRVLAVEAVYRGLMGEPAALTLPTRVTPSTTPVTLFPYDE